MVVNFCVRLLLSFLLFSRSVGFPLYPDEYHESDNMEVDTNVDSNVDLNVEGDEPPSIYERLPSPVKTVANFVGSYFPSLGIPPGRHRPKAHHYNNRIVLSNGKVNFKAVSDDIKPSIKSSVNSNNNQEMAIKNLTDINSLLNYLSTQPNNNPTTNSPIKVIKPFEHSIFENITQLFPPGAPIPVNMYVKPLRKRSKRPRKSIK